MRPIYKAQDKRDKRDKERNRVRKGEKERATLGHVGVAGRRGCQHLTRNTLVPFSLRLSGLAIADSRRQIDGEADRGVVAKWACTIGKKSSTVCCIRLLRQISMGAKGINYERKKVKRNLQKKLKCAQYYQHNSKRFQGLKRIKR